MDLGKKNLGAVWFDSKQIKVMVIDQQLLPFKYAELELKTLDDAFLAIKDMIVRGAPLIGIVAAYGLYLWVNENKNKLNADELDKAAAYLKSSRPTAVNLEFEIENMVAQLKKTAMNKWVESSLKLAKQVEAKENNACSAIGDFGLELIETIWNNTNRTVNVLTHCNAGWLACGKWGTATAPIYKAIDKGIPVHVWVDETRPRNQGSKLTAWELQQANVPYTVIPDNTGGHLMQHKMVDLVIVGSDRTTRNGDVANKIGTYLKALAAYDNDVPFYVALPSSTIDFKLANGVKNIPIEQRDNSEVTHMDVVEGGIIKQGRIMMKDTNVANYGFDVTPARLVTALITERGICNANEESILKLFPEGN